MAIDLSPEKENFANAKYGREVRGSMVSLADKIEREVNDVLEGVFEDIDQATKEWLDEHPEVFDRIVKDYVTPQMYGAVGDGVEDDTAAFESCLQSGEDIFIPNGTYKISSTLHITNAVMIVGQDLEKTIIKYTNNDWEEAEEYWHGAQLIDGVSYRPPFLFQIGTRYFQKPTISNLSFVGNGNNGLFLVISKDLAPNGSIAWGASANIDNFYAKDFVEPFRLFSCFQVSVRNGNIINGGTNWFDYVPDPSLGTTYPETKFNNCNFFENCFFVKQNTMSAVPVVNLVFSRQAVFTNCQFQNYNTAIASDGVSSNTVCTDCWFENINYIWNLDRANNVVNLIGGRFVNVKAYSKYKYDGNLPDFATEQKPRDIFMKTKGSNSQYDLLHNTGASIFTLPYLRNPDDTRGEYFYPYSISTSGAMIYVPVNTYTAEVQDGTSVTLDLEAVTRGSAQILATFDITVYAQYYATSLESSRLLAKCSIFKFSNEYVIGRIDRVVNTGYAEDAVLSIAMDDTPGNAHKLIVSLTRQSDQNNVPRKLIVAVDFKVNRATNTMN